MSDTFMTREAFLDLVDKLGAAYREAGKATLVERDACISVCEEYASELAATETQPGSGSGRRGAVMECVRRMRARK